MFESLTDSKDHAIAILKQDHETVKKLFDEFESTHDLKERQRIAKHAIEELKIHAEIEENIFYPAVRGEVAKNVMDEADEEHHVAKLLIAELDKMKGTEDHWEAKFIVLAENIRHHIKEEESEMMPAARGAKVDFDMLGRQLIAMKHMLKREGIPQSDEAKLMSLRKTIADSPAKAAKKHANSNTPTTKKKTA